MSQTPMFKAMMIPAAVASIVLLGAVAGCAASTGAVGTADNGNAPAPALTPVALTHESNATVVRLKPGQELRLVLPSNPSTGYSWALARQPANLESLEPEQYEPSAGATPMPGRGGQTTWHYRASKPGTDRLSLVYRRPWAADEKPAGTFECEVLVE